MRLLGGRSAVPVGELDTPEIGSHAKCIKERKMALIAKGRLKERLEERGLQIEIKGYDDTPKHRLSHLNEWGRDRAQTAQGGFARTWLRTIKTIGALASVHYHARRPSSRTE